MPYRRSKREKRRQKKGKKRERVKASPKKRLPRRQKVEHPFDCPCFDCLFGGPGPEYDRPIHQRPKPWRPPT
jgi:hypothetical protein